MIATATAYPPTTAPQLRTIEPAHYHWHIIVNRTAGGGLSDANWTHIEAALASLLPQRTVHFTQPSRRADHLVEQLVKEGASHLLAVGGDGTHHEAVNGIVRAAGPQSDRIVYALLPIGTGNDWTRTHAIPRQLPAWVAMFKCGQLHQQNVGELQYCVGQQPRTAYFANVAGLAYDGYVVRAAQQQPSHQRGRWFYLWLIVRCLFDYQPERACLQFAGHRVEDHFYTINIGIGRYSGGGMQFTPQADPRGRFLALTFARSVSKLTVLLNTPRFYRGTLGRHPRITTTRTATVAITAPTPVPLEADGEYLGTTPVTVSLLPLALTFIGNSSAK